MKSKLAQMITQRGEVLQDLSSKQSLLLVFLRPFGCIFCMDSMFELTKHRAFIEAKNIKIVFIHMATNEVAESYFSEYGLTDIDHISDQNCDFYASFDLLKADFNQIYGLQTWLRGGKLAIQNLRRVRMKQIGDGFQIPGVFYLEDGEVKNKFVYKTISDRPDYRRIIQVK